MRFLDKLSQLFSQVFIWIAGGFLAAMILLLCANIFFRIVWVPIDGTFELMGYFGSVVTSFALGYTQRKGGHIAVDILVLQFPRKAKNILLGLSHLICFLFFVLIAWQIAKYATTLWKTGEVTETLKIIYYPFTYSVAAGCIVLCLVFLTDFLNVIFKKEENPK